jgi:ribosomal protein S18 acetylase RimI-like enzyme
MHGDGKLASMTAHETISYARETSLPVAEFREVLASSGLGATRPVDDALRLQAMISGANLVMTARRESGELVGVARCSTDFAWNCYLSDLAVSASAQGLGVGRGLLGAVRREIGPQVSLVLVSVPDAVGFYERAGMAVLPNCFWFKRTR